MTFLPPGPKTGFPEPLPYIPPVPAPAPQEFKTCGAGITPAPQEFLAVRCLTHRNDFLAVRCGSGVTPQELTFSNPNQGSHFAFSFDLLSFDFFSSV